MADVKQILVVDDHFEMLEFLRSMLELSNQDYEVLAVPSAEEGLLELQRARFDLVITDVRLPGMSGFDLVRRLQRLERETPVIMITAYSSAEGRKEAESLGVYRYFKKPLDTDDVLTAVHTALHGESVVLTEARKEPAEVTAVSDDLSAELQKRLETLRTDTGALQLMLATVEGDILYAAGKSHRLDLPKLVEIIARTVQDGFLLAERLESENPFTLQYHAGEKVELYCANVGQRYFLTIFFDAASRRGRIGTIWVFTQRAIRDLLTMLPTDGTAVLESLPEETTMPQPPPLPEGDGAPAPESGASEEAPPILKAAAPLPRPEVVPLDVPESELAELLAAAGEEETADAELDLDAYWEDALSQGDESQDMLRGLSLEEAQQQGLIPKELNEEESNE